MIFSKDINNKLYEVYPFLIPRNVFTDEVVDFDGDGYVLGVDELPKGWIRLFLLFCKHLKKALVKNNYLNEFRFTQIKEKYGSMRLYNNGYPINSNDDLCDLEYIYEHLSTYICEECGNQAKYESEGWISQYCDKCFDKFFVMENDDKKRFKKGRRCFKIVLGQHSATQEYHERTIDCKVYWLEYLQCLKMDDSKFLNYILNESEDMTIGERL